MLSAILAEEMYRKRHVGTKVDEIMRGKQLWLVSEDSTLAFYKILCEEIGTLGYLL